ncbi:hypothetical protein OFC04_24910, partial [Escherichia coli]|nr:hypothetical protein [Escherichia coli]
TLRMGNPIAIRAGAQEEACSEDYRSSGSCGLQSEILVEMGFVNQIYRYSMKKLHENAPRTARQGGGSDGEKKS